jgi:hypothetical protein
VLVLGGGGFYGRYIVSDLLRFTDAHLTVASRQPPQDLGLDDRVNIVHLDIQDYEPLKDLVASYDVVIHCAAPFHYLPLNPLYAAIETGTDYIDISEDRVFACEIRKLREQINMSGITALNGISVSPGMEVLFADMFSVLYEELLSVRTFAAPDTKKHRGQAMFHTMLTGVGRPFSQLRNGEFANVYGWTEPEWLQFPPPLGRRLTYLVLEMANLDLVPELFNVHTVEFKAGTEHHFLNRILGFAAVVRMRTGVPNWERFTTPVRALSWLFGRFGLDAGGVVFEISGRANELRRTDLISVIAENNGGLIPSVLAGIATQELLSGRVGSAGLVPLDSWLSSDQLIVELLRRELKIWWLPHGEHSWRIFDLAEFRQLEKSLTL